MKKPDKHKNRIGFDTFLYFFFGISFLVIGVIMVVFDIHKVGRHNLTTQQTALGGGFVIFISLVCFYVGYYFLTPFSKIREFIEGTKRK